MAWMGYLYLAALVMDWQSGSLATLSPMVAANGFLVAVFLPAWRLRRRGMRLLQINFFSPHVLDPRLVLAALG